LGQQHLGFLCHFICKITFEQGQLLLGLYDYQRAAILSRIEVATG
jgi:hypothetical protein